MTYTTDYFVRLTVGALLRVDEQGKFWCQTCLAKFALEKLGAGYRESDIDRAMDEVFKTPGALNRIPAFICARCGKTMPCLGVSKKPKQGGSRA
jgi:hypothetical protein